MDLDGSVLNFSFAATLIRVRNRSKDLRRSITVDGTGRPDTASNASSETAQLTRRMPSRISKRIKFPSKGVTVLDVPLTSIPLRVICCAHQHRRLPPRIRLAWPWQCRECTRLLHLVLPHLFFGLLSSCVEFAPKVWPVSSSRTVRPSGRTFRPSLLELNSHLKRAHPSGDLAPADLLPGCRRSPSRWHEIHIICPQT